MFRQTACRRVRRTPNRGSAGLPNTSSRRRPTSRGTSAEHEPIFLNAVHLEFRFPASRGAHRVPARTVRRILEQHGVPRSADCDPLTGVSIRPTRTTANWYERERTGELVHLDVKTLGCIPNDGGWRPHRTKTVPARPTLLQARPTPDSNRHGTDTSSGCDVPAFRIESPGAPRLLVDGTAEASLRSVLVASSGGSSLDSRKTRSGSGRVRSRRPNWMGEPRCRGRGEHA